jgi:hypothetical protein
MLSSPDSNDTAGKILFLSINFKVLILIIKQKKKIVIVALIVVRRLKQERNDEIVQHLLRIN